MVVLLLQAVRDPARARRPRGPTCCRRQFDAWQGFLRSPVDWAPIIRAAWVSRDLRAARRGGGLHSLPAPRRRRRLSAAHADAEPRPASGRGALRVRPSGGARGYRCGAATAIRAPPRRIPNIGLARRSGDDAAPLSTHDRERPGARRLPRSRQTCATRRMLSGVLPWMNAPPHPIPLSFPLPARPSPQR